METREEFIAFIREAAAEGEKLASMESETHAKGIEYKKLAKSLESETKAMEDSIEMTVRKRKNELEGSFDEELSKADSLLRKAKSSRAKAKEKGQNERIFEETSELRDEIRRRKIEIKTVLKKENVPGFCNTRLFFALTSPSGIKDILIILLCFAICFAAVPLCVYWLSKGETPLQLVLIYVCAIVLFGGIYFLAFIKPAMKHGPVLKQIRQIRAAIASKEKQVSAISKGIREDKDEAMYGLGSFDENISAINEEKGKIAERKKAALEDFEKETAPRLTEEIRANHRERLNTLDTDMKAARSEYESMEAVLQEQRLSVAQKYETVLGKDYKKEELDMLIAYLERGKAANISEAQSLYKMGARLTDEEEV